MTAPVYRAVDAHSGRSLPAVLIELDAALQRCEVLDGENHALRALVDELRGKVVELTGNPKRVG